MYIGARRNPFPDTDWKVVELTAPCTLALSAISSFIPMHQAHANERTLVYYPSMQK